MSRFKLLPETGNWSVFRLNLTALIVLGVGFAIRLWGATSSFVNPDEAYHALLSTPAPFADLLHSAARSPHPPLFIFCLHYIRTITTADLGIRLLPLLAGSLFPLMVYRWIGRGWNKYAGLAALTILTLAPPLIQVSTEARAYALVLFFMASALYLLDRSIETSSPVRMAGFALCLYGAILSDYSAAFFVLAAGLYFLMRITEKSVTTGVRILWELSQVGAVVLYSFLWVTQVAPMQGITEGRTDVSGWLRDAYLQPGQNVVAFLVRNTAQQFAYLLPLLAPAVGAMLLFAAGIWLLWRKPQAERFWHSRATVLLMVVPFLATFTAACTHLFPYGRTRHTIFLAIFIATGVAIAIDRVARSWIVPLVALATVLTPLWHALEGRYRWEIGRIENKKEYMVQAIDFLKRSVPPGTAVLTESELRVVLAYYLDTGIRLPEVHGTPSEEMVGGYRMFAGRWSFASLDELRDDLRLIRGNYGFGPDARIWVLDGGFLPLLKPDFERLQKSGDVPDLFEFGRAMIAVLTPPGFLWEEPRPDDRLPELEEQPSAAPPAFPNYR